MSRYFVTNNDTETFYEPSLCVIDNEDGGINSFSTLKGAVFFIKRRVRLSRMDEPRYKNYDFSQDYILIKGETLDVKKEIQRSRCADY